MAGIAEKLHKKIETKRITLGVIGIGYVGEALGFGAAMQGFNVVGYSRTKEKVEEFNRRKIENFRATNNFSDLGPCEVICICVPTPVHEDKTPDLSAVIEVTTKLSTILRRGMLIILESSVAPGTTRNILLPILEKSGLKVEDDFFLAFSPERIDPGNKKFIFSNIPKVVAGYKDASLSLAKKFYENLVVSVFAASTLEVAEMSKVFENTFRYINISLVNEISEYTKMVGIDIWEVINAASTKPFGFIPHYPGPGVGGHCIPVDPHYLREDAKKYGISLSMIEAAEEVNQKRASIITSHVLEIINSSNKTKKHYKVLIVGVTYKPDVADTRESPAILIWEELSKNGIEVVFHDPYIQSLKGISSSSLSKETLKSCDMAILVTHHSIIDYGVIEQSGIPILDTQNLLKQDVSRNIFRLSQIPLNTLRP